MINNKIEILSPAGNLEKLKYAVNYGADAVYLALKSFGMRAAADNFTFDELREGIEYAHSKGVKVYVTLNIMPRDKDFDLLREILETMKTITPDAVIVSDAGVIRMIRTVFPELEIHLSTQTSTVNSYTCNFWYELGIKRIVLARELSLEEIKEIRKNIPSDMELEVFVHGAMCVSYSGRCLLSNYFTRRDANSGKCAQPCRWKYYVSEEKRPDIPLTVEQHEEGTYLFSSKDMCMLRHLKELKEAGVSSLKIEGRMKSAYYTAVITNAYRMALDDVENDRPFNEKHYDEVCSVSRREYDTGYFFDSPNENAQICQTNEYIREKAFLATVEDYIEATGLCVCMQRNKMTLGDKVQLLSPNAVGRDVSIEALYDMDMQPIESTPHPQMLFYAKIGKAKKGDIIRGN